MAICAENSPFPAQFPAHSQGRGALMFSLIYVWIKGWINNREAGDLRRYRAHYDVTVMTNGLARCNGGLTSSKQNNTRLRRVGRLRWFGQPGGRLNKKDGLTRYGNSHVKDKTS